MLFTLWYEDSVLNIIDDSNIFSQHECTSRRHLGRVGGKTRSYKVIRFLTATVC